MTDVHIVPLYNISMRIPDGVAVFCSPSLEELYPEAVCVDFLTIRSEILGRKSN